jgi:hypothetical protein
MNSDLIKDKTRQVHFAARWQAKQMDLKVFKS